MWQGGGEETGGLLPAGAVKELVRDAPADRAAALEGGTLVDEDLLQDEVVAVQVEVVLRVCSSRFDRLGDVAGRVLRRELELRQGVRHLHALDRVGHEPRLAGRAPDKPLHC